MDRPRCETCAYWDAGECKRFPPVINMDGKFTYHWPETADVEWCGEHPDFPAYIASLKSAPPEQTMCPECGAPETTDGTAFIGCVKCGTARLIRPIAKPNPGTPEG